MPSRRATVLLPLPLSPTRATISDRPTSRSTSSTACRKRRLKGPPRRKRLLRLRATSSGPAGAGRSAGTDAEDADRGLLAIGIEVTADGCAFGLDLGRLLDEAAGHGLRAARVEAAAGGR